MQNYYEVFYGDDNNEKMKIIKKMWDNLDEFKINNFYTLIKSIIRVINDGLKFSISFTLVCLKLIYKLKNNLNENEEEEEENEKDEIKESLLKLFERIIIWEFARLNRIYTKYKNEKNDDKKIETKMVLSMNSSILNQSKIFTVIIILIKDIIFNNDENYKYLDILIKIRFPFFLIKCLDYNEEILLRSAINMIDLLSKKNSSFLKLFIENGLIMRLNRFFRETLLSNVYSILYLILKNPECRKYIFKSKILIKNLVDSLNESNNRNEKIFILNLISNNKQGRINLLKYKCLEHLMYLFDKIKDKLEQIKDDKEKFIKFKNSNYLYWNLLINLSNEPIVCESILKSKKFESFLNFALKNSSFECLKFINNIFYFCDSVKLKQKHSKSAEKLFLNFDKENLDNSINSEIIAVMNNCGLSIPNILEKVKSLSLYWDKINNDNLILELCLIFNKLLMRNDCYKKLIKHNLLNPFLDFFYNSSQIEVNFSLNFIFLNILLQNKSIPYSFENIIENYNKQFPLDSLRTKSLFIELCDTFISNICVEQLEKNINISEQIQSINNFKRGYIIGQIYLNEDENDEYDENYYQYEDYEDNNYMYNMDSDDDEFMINNYN